MSSLVDMCTAELNKLREKSQNISSGGSSHGVAEADKPAVAAKGASVTTAVRPVPNLKLLYSDAAISMFMECFSP